MSKISTNNLNLMAEAQQMKKELSDLRRKIHQQPELGMEEYQTAQLVTEFLQSLGIKTERVAGTGVIGLLEGGFPGRTVGLRADMDALPILELNQSSYMSKLPGKMHACGHDAHTAAMLGAAKILAGHRDSLQGNVKFFFQPNEEKEGGAQKMVDAGGLENPNVSAMFGAHVNPNILVGKMGLIYGKSYAASNTFDVLIKGKGSHGAEPHQGVDAIAIGAQIISTMQQFVSRQVDPVDSAVVTVGTFSGGTQRNIIANEAKFSGIIRTLDPETRNKAKQQIPNIIRSIGEALGAEIEITLCDGYPSLINDQAMTDLVRQSAIKMLGEEQVLILKQPTLGTEDFGVFLEHVPGCFYQLGVGNPEKNIGYPLHNGRFDVDEDCLPMAAAIHARVAMDYLERY